MTLFAARGAKKEVEALLAAYEEAREAEGDMTRQEDALYEAVKGRPGRAYDVANQLEAGDANEDFVLKIAKSANDGTHGTVPEVLDTYALARWNTGDYDGAKDTQKEAIRLCDALELPCEGERERFKIYSEPLETEDAGTEPEAADAEANDAGSIDAARK